MSIFAQHRVFRLAREHGLKVLLDGQGADELLAGYRPLIALRLLSLLRRGRFGGIAALLSACRGLPEGRPVHQLARAVGLLLPGRLRDRLRAAAGESLTPAWMNGRWFARQGVQIVSRAAPRGRDALRDALLAAVHETSLPALLRYEDRNSMAHSIESRVPFLTPELAEFCLSLPEEHMIGADGLGKRVLRAAMRGIVPDEVLDRRDKIGFAAPERRWLTSRPDWVASVLSPDRLARVPCLRPAAVLEGWRRIAAGRGGYDGRLWRWINLIRWVDRFDISFDN